MKFLLVSILTLSSLIAKSQEVRSYPMDESSLLWEITGPNMSSKSYLFGTMHLIEKEFFYFPKKLKKIVSKSDQLVMELEGLPNQTEAMSMVMLKEGSFFDYFNEQQIDSILVWAKQKFSMEEPAFRAGFSKMKPFVIVQMATQIQFMGKTESYELTLDEIAVANEIEIIGLETVAQQMSFFDDLTDDQQTEMVMSGIRDEEEAVNLIRDMQEVYSEQNVDDLYQMVQEKGGVMADEQAKFLDNRNANWIPKIIELVENKDTFIAVGAGHLGGPNGVIRLLEKEGYTLKPVKI
ncbi:MAG: TraB/GumN family protein [Crocinitomicaceae bacterium]|nr:TraB/GumN family protein [Crocinitomicaceae bacterium]